MASKPTIPERQRQFLITATKSKISQLKDELEEAQEALEYLENQEVTAKTIQRKHKWTKIVIESIESLGSICGSDDIYSYVMDKYQPEMFPELERRVVVTRLSSAISQLKKGEQIICHESNTGEKVYGLKDWYKGAHLFVSKLGKYQENNIFQKYGIKAVLEPNQAVFEDYNAVKNGEELPDLPF